MTGSMYWDNNLGALFYRYNDGTTTQWVQAAGASSNVITTPVTLYVATTGNDTTGQGTLAAPWATPQRAMQYLSDYTIEQGVAVTVSVADGTYTFTSPLYLNHPNGSQITINGGSTSGARPTTSLNGGGVRGNTGATLAANDALLNAYYNTKFQFNGCHGLVCETGGNVTVNTVLIRGNAAAGFFGVLAGGNSGSVNYASSGGINLGNKVAVHNFGSVGVYTNLGGSISADGVTVTNTGSNGMALGFGGSISASGAVVSNNGANGVSIAFGGSLLAGGATVSNNSSNGVVVNSNGSANIGGATASNNGATGITTQFGGSINAQGATASNNSGDGIAVNYGGFINANITTVSSNSGNGVVVQGGGTMTASSATVSTNGLRGIAANSAGSIIAGSATVLTNSLPNVYASGSGFVSFTGGNAAGSLSPAANTVGNGNAYILV
jgi:hypothetical protein